MRRAVPLVLAVVVSAAAGGSAACTRTAADTGLTRFYTQSLDWSDCAPFAGSDYARKAFTGEFRCARLTVPLDYTRPGGPTVTVGVLRHAATNRAERVGSLVVNPGGPGGSGMVAAASLAATSNELVERFDLVGFDPRGIGASEPRIECLTDAETDAWRAGPPLSGEQLLGRGADLAGKCAQRSGRELLAHVGVSDVARDLDVLRAVLGDDQLSYLGYSYGSRIGTAYAERFADNVRVMLLDGAVNPGEDALSRSLGQVSALKRAFARFAAWCAQSRGCALGTDPAAAPTRLRRLLDPLIAAPVRVGERRLSYGDAATAVIMAMYRPDTWMRLADGLAALRGGSGDTLLRMADDRFGRNPDGSYDRSAAAATAILCADDPPVTDLDRVRAELGALSGPTTGWLINASHPLLHALVTCPSWPVPATDGPHRPQVRNLSPPLVVSITEDPATPHDDGIALAEALGGRLLTFQGHQHGVFLRNGNTCVNTAGIRYLLYRTLPAAGTRCR